jgi:hypothetical protein
MRPERPSPLSSRRWGAMVVVHMSEQRAFRLAPARVTGTVGLCLPAVFGCASSSVSGGLIRARRFRHRAQGSLHRSSRSLVFSRPGRLKWRDSISVRLLSARRPKRPVHGRPLSPPPPSHRCRCFGQQPGTLRRQRTTSPPLGSRAPSAAESRANATSPPLRSSRHTYAGFATSAVLPTCLHAMRSCARSFAPPDVSAAGREGHMPPIDFCQS